MGSGNNPSQMHYTPGHIFDQCVDFIWKIAFLEHLLIRNTVPRHSLSDVRTSCSRCSETSMISRFSQFAVLSDVYTLIWCWNLNRIKEAMKGMLDVRAPKKKYMHFSIEIKQRNIQTNRAMQQGIFEGKTMNNWLKVLEYLQLSLHIKHQK